MTLGKLDQVVTNYEALSETYRTGAQDNAYNDAKAYKDFKKKAEEEAVEQENDTPKSYIGGLLEISNL